MIRPLALLAALGLVAAAPAPAPSGAYPPMPAAGPPKPFQVPASETYRLPNGLQVTLIPYGQVPKATIGLLVYAGALNEGEDTGIASLTSQMMREGAAGHKGAQIAAEAASMGGNLGVGADDHQTSIFLSVLSEHAADAVRLVGDVGLHPDFPASEFARIKQNYVRGIAVAKSRPQVEAEVALARAVYGPTHPYGRGFPTDAQLARYTLDDAKRFYAQNFGARRARLYVAGRFDEAAVKAAIAEVFGSWQPGPERLSLPPNPQPGPKVILIDRPGAPQSTIRIAYPAPVAGDPQDIGFRVTNALLGGSFTSRITHNIREVKGYTYSPGSGIGFNPTDAQWEFSADVTTSVTGPAFKEIFGEIRRLQNEAPPEEEARGIRTWMAGVFVLQNASQGGLINSLANRDFLGLPSNWLESYVPNVLSISSADIERLARERLPLDKATIVVVGDLAKVEPQLKALPELQGVTFQRVTPFG